MHTTAPAAPDQATVDLASRVQRRRDFTAHLTGFLTGALVLGVLCWHLPGLRGGAAAALLAWSTALSFQHFRHVLRGPVTAADVAAEHARLTPRR
jgi:ferric-dicitrate binding protein FerR (iron transport regulator)